MNWPGSCGRIETPCRTRQGAQEVPDIMLSFYLSALESAADKEDFRALYRRYHGVMERTALAILQNPRDAEEAVQEAFIRVIENFSKIYEIPCKNLGPGSLL